MEFYETVRRRRMVRAFTSEPVAEATRDRILSAMSRGPSAGFSQGFGFVVLEGPDAVRFWDVAWPVEERQGPHAGVTEAPLVIIPCADKHVYLERYAEPDKGWTDKAESNWPTPFWIVDTAFASMLGLLAVVEEGLGALFLGLQREPAIKEAFDIPDEVKPIGAIAIGHPLQDVPSPSLQRGHRDDLIRMGSWRSSRK